MTNAKAFLNIQKEFGSFDAYIWKFVGGTPKVNHWKHMNQVPATSPESDALSKDLKKRGFRFVGSIVMYAHMQATGLVNDHTTDCFLSARKRKGKQAKKDSSAHAVEQVKSRAANPIPSIKKQPKSLRPSSSFKAINIKRVYETPDKTDGRRVLIDRLWPRGISKVRAHVDLWLPNVAPSTTLRKWFNHDPSRWEEFQRRYRLELEQCPDEVKKLRQHTQDGPTTLIYSAQNETCNNAIALLAYLTPSKKQF